MIDNDFFKFVNENDKVNSFSDTKVMELFNMVDSYAKKYYQFIAPEYGYKYNIRYNENFYEVGVLYGPCNLYYIEKTEPIDNFIDFENILNDKIRGKENIEVYMHMQNIMAEFDELYRMGAPMDLALNEVKRYIMKKIY